MIPRTDPHRTPQPDPDLRVVEPAGPAVAGPGNGSTAGPMSTRTDGTITYADRDFVLASARRMLEIHRDTFHKLAE